MLYSSKQAHFVIEYFQSHDNLLYHGMDKNIEYFLWHLWWKMGQVTPKNSFEFQPTMTDAKLWLKNWKNVMFYYVPPNAILMLSAAYSQL